MGTEPIPQRDEHPNFGVSPPPVVPAPLLRRGPAAAPLLLPKAGASPPRSLFDTFLEAVFCSGFVCFFSPLNKFLPVFNETHRASSPSALLGGSGGFGDVCCRVGRRWDCRGLSLPCRVSTVSCIPKNPSWGSGRVFRAVSWSKRGKQSHPQSLQVLSKPQTFHQMPRGGVDLPPLGAEAPHKVPAGSHLCVPSGDAWSWGQTRPSCVENSRCGFICCFTTDQGICRRIFLGRGCVCVQDLPCGEALGCRTQGGRGQGDTPRGGCGDPACSGGAWGGLGPLLGSFVGLV